MTDDDMRAIVRDVIAERVRSGAQIPPRPSLHDSSQNIVEHRHASHGIFPLAQGGDGDGACLIEPAVRCTHCGYCQSYGH